METINKEEIILELNKIEASVEEIFSKIADTPVVTKEDYILLSYFENMCQLIEKADKIINTDQESK